MALMTDQTNPGPPPDWHTQFPPEKWQEILSQAIQDLRKDPHNTEALDAIKDANLALNAYEQPAIQAGENVGESGFGKPMAALAGLGEAALDVPKGAIHMLTQSPITTIKELGQLPSQLLEGIASGDPERIARTVGNVGSFALPFAKATRLGSLAGATVRAVTKPFKAAGAALDIPEARLAESVARRNLAEARRAAVTSAPPSRVAGMAEEQLTGRQLQNEILRQRLSKLSEDLSGSAPETMNPIPGSTQGFEVTGSRATPPIPTEPTLAEMSGTANLMRSSPRVAGQKGITFGRETTFNKLTQAEIKQLLGEITRAMARRGQ